MLRINHSGVSLLVNTPKYPIDHVNRLGWAALMEAVVLGDGSAKFKEIVQLLIDAGCDILKEKFSRCTKIEK